VEEEILLTKAAQAELELRLRSISAWVLMVMFIVLTPVGAGFALGSPWWGLAGFGITSGIGSYIIGKS
jgi:hypothetical protein